MKFKIQYILNQNSLFNNLKNIVAELKDLESFLGLLKTLCKSTVLLYEIKLYYFTLTCLLILKTNKTIRLCYK